MSWLIDRATARAKLIVFSYSFSLEYHVFFRVNSVLRRDVTFFVAMTINMYLSKLILDFHMLDHPKFRSVGGGEILNNSNFSDGN